MKRILSLLAAVLLLEAAAPAQTRIAREFGPATDSLKARLQRRTSVNCSLKITKVVKRGSSLDFYFSQELGDYPWRRDDIDWFRNQLRELAPDAWREYAIGDIYAKNTLLTDLPMPPLSWSGSPRLNSFRVTDPRAKTVPLVRGDDSWPQGLSGRHIALWQSHGRYWEAKTDRWEWQRAATHRTVEDLYTQSYVLPFLIPMLENAGACVVTPRERDTQVFEVVCDNDPAFSGPRTGLVRRQGSYHESGNWDDGGTGFADAKEVYSGTDNPFTMGTARMCAAIGVDDAHRKAEIRWRPDIPEKGYYAVYVSYKSLSNSTTDARYTVRHLGGETDLHVNQRMGGGTWVYLGTFLFDEGDGGYVKLTNRSDGQGVVTADAVRFGGGMGKVDRGGGISGYPAYTEGALYNMQWAGIDLTLFDKWDDDYTKDYAGRGIWVQNLAGGSRAIPSAAGRKVPFDLSLAFHSDAGVTPNDSIVGTLAIYTELCDGSDKLPDGESRLSGRMLSDLVQTQVVQDIRAGFEPKWSRRGLWNRSYSESRTTGVPALLLELLSHQNFADMRYGLDPSFRFTASRAVYKGILKYLSYRYGCTYAVQPLPVHAFSAVLKDGKVRLDWEPTPDQQEPTAEPKGYILYTRVDDGAFDGGVRVEGTSAEVPVTPGHVYSFRVAAWNDGGKSFPSETLSAGIPRAGAPTVLLVNNFTRVSAPDWFDTPSYAGFMDNMDSGVPYIEDILFCGQVNMFDRTSLWTDDDNPGFGGSFTNEAGKKVAGNTFDFPAVHGRALLKAGYAFCSTSSEAFSALSPDGFAAVDLICGKQVTTRIGRGAVPDRYPVFSKDVQEALRTFTQAGAGVLVSGAYIATDAWDHVYPGVSPDISARIFIQDVLGYKWITNYGDISGYAVPRKDAPLALGTLRYNRAYSPLLYRVENPDGIAPASDKSVTILRYHGTDIPAATAYDPGTYRAVSIGFPLETLTDQDALDETLKAIMGYLLQNHK